MPEPIKSSPIESLVTSERKDAATDFVKDAVPDLGDLAIAVLSMDPIIAALFLGSIAVRHTEEYIKDIDEATNALADILAAPIGATQEDKNKHLHEAKNAMAKFQSDLAGAGTDPDPIGTQFKLIRTFADVYIDGLKDLVNKQGELDVATLQHQNASREQIVAAQQRTRAKIAWLDQQKKFFDGSGLLKVEQDARQKAKPQLNAEADAAIVAAGDAKAKNDDQQAQIQALQNETGKGKLGPRDPAFVHDQAELEKQIREAEIDLETTFRIRRQCDEYHDLYTDEQWNEFIKPYDDAVAKAQKKLDELKSQTSKKERLLSDAQSRESDRNKLQAQTATDAQQKSQIATNNQKRIDQLPGEIAQAEFAEQVQDAFAADTAVIQGQIDSLNASPPSEGRTVDEFSMPAPSLRPVPTGQHMGANKDINIIIT